ncbi:MAG: Methionyl-tRNA formyltransferase [Bathelium mastoideum]|nr:MAG: Methionyl-tRNA formyltransferase [Bathelium mastoideum]
MQLLLKASSRRLFTFHHANSVNKDKFLSTTKAHEPLRILFCGSDAFSIASLKAVHVHFTRTRPDTIASLDVVCRPAKRIGRGLKRVREVPIKEAAQQLDLRVHEIDTFTGWQPPRPDGFPINLVLAVSFGLLVPPRILNNARYGGLNVHPSLLPEGPAPLHHTLLQRRERTGVTIQTLHPKHFDQGAIVAQTPRPGIVVPNRERCTPDQLLHVLAPVGGEMLVEALEEKLFMHPINSIEPFTGLGDATELFHAHKIMSNDRRIDWNTWTADDILLRQRVLGKLWDDEVYRRCSFSPACTPGEVKRVNYLAWRLPDAHATLEGERMAPGTPCWGNLPNIRNS